MTLRRKLLTIFGGLGLLALLVVGVTFWMMTQWSSSSDALQEHYQRSLLLQRIRAATFRAFKEVPDAAFAGDEGARGEFEALLELAEEDFEAWGQLAFTEAERAQVAGVREAYDGLVHDAREALTLVEAGRQAEAVALIEGRLERANFATFEARSDEAVQSDRRTRAAIRARVEGVRRTAQIILIVAALSTLSLIFLLAAYLASDLFKPLRALERALRGAARGDLDARLDEGRGDEFGAVHRAFNGLLEATRRRERAAASGLSSEEPAPEPDALRAATSRRLLHRLVGGLRAEVAGLRRAEAPPSEADTTELLTRLDELSHALMRVTEFSFPLDLTLARTDLRDLLYEVVVRFRERFAERNVSLELEVDPALKDAVVDRLKLREALSELLTNALDALPERGGRVGLRATVEADGAEVLLEVADNGRGADAALFERVLRDEDARHGVGLRLTKAIVEEHGGRFELESEPGQGTYVGLRLPLYT